jgi:hypothetical protein
MFGFSVFWTYLSIHVDMVCKYTWRDYSISLRIELYNFPFLRMIVMNFYLLYWF